MRFLIFFPLFILSSIAFPCTSFLNSTAQRSVVAKDFDWNLGHGLLIVNKQNVQKVALVVENTDMPLMWVSKYGSVTFNQLGRELPYGGMNEKGLVIEILWLNETEYPPLKPEVMEVNESQWIQSMLDRAQNIAEVINFNKEIQIESRHAKVHYFVCESTGACAIFEFLNGNLVLTHLDGRDDIKAITNNSYRDSKLALSKNVPKDNSSLSRYVRTAKLIKGSKDSTPLVPATFKILNSVADPETQWSIVYDPSNLKIFFKTKKRKEIKEVSLNYFDWSCSAKVKVLDINTPYKQDVSSRFEDYKEELNTSIVEQNDFLPEKSWKAIETAPGRDHCI